ncbi:MAG: hypothetical protein Q7T04_03755 [Dehalococcoidia bacterium]|nr:hypothetical protein [Dehalococcoidia bacterium]
MSGKLFFRLVGLVAFGVLGGWGAEAVSQLRDTYWVAAAAVAAAAVGFGIAPYLTTAPFNGIMHRLEKAKANVIVSGTLGLLLGLIVSALLALPLSMLPGAWGRLLPITLTVFLGYLGISVMVSHEKELAHVFGGFVPGRASGGESCGKMLVDTSAIIDGRIADISQSGFIQGSLLIPKFILDELQHISDSADAMRRNRGRRGLEILARPQKESEAPVQIIEGDVTAVQGGGFLEDGTMVVVEGGRRYMNTELDIVVSRVLQTAAGKMIFAHLRNVAKDEPARR